MIDYAIAVKWLLKPFNSKHQIFPPFKYPIWRYIVRSDNVSVPRDMCLELSDGSDIWCNVVETAIKLQFDIIQTITLAASRFDAILK